MTIRITLRGGREFHAAVVGVDSRYDFALSRVRIGRIVTLSMLRRGKLHRLRVTL